MSDANPCVFINHQKNNILILAIYVDDGITVGTDKSSITSVIQHLREQFEVKAMKVGCFLGFEIKKESDGSIFMHQTVYAKKVLHKFQMEECNPVTTPIDPNQVLCEFEESVASKFPYRQLVGSLMYLATGTRPDISYAISNVSKFMEKPTEAHEKAFKRILKYIKGTISHGILFSKQGNHRLYGFSDADYAGDVQTRKSTSGFTFMYNNSMISWRSTLQRSVSQSTTESEYIAAAEADKELIWLKRLFGELVPNQTENVVSFMDNMSAICLVKNSEFHRRTKHINVRYHFIRDEYEKGTFNLEHISTDEIIADSQRYYQGYDLSDFVHQ